MQYLVVALAITAIVVISGITIQNSRRASQARLNLTTSAAQATKGLEAYKNGDFDKAASSMQQAIKLDPRNAENKRVLGQSLEAKGKLADASKVYAASLVDDPNQPDVLYYLAGIYKYQGKTDKAVVELEKAVRINSKFIAARLVLGDLYVQQGKQGKAKKQYEKIIEMQPFGGTLEKAQAKLEALAN